MTSMFCDTFRVNHVDLDVDATEKARSEAHKKHQSFNEEADKIKEKKFDQVSRIIAKSEFYDYTLTIDVNTNIYPIKEKEKIEVMLADTLNEGETQEEEGYNPAKKLDTRALQYGYIMQGRVYKYSQAKHKADVYASFGGLLMQLNGSAQIISKARFSVDNKIYIFIRKADTT